MNDARGEGAGPARGCGRGGGDGQARAAAAALRWAGLLSCGVLLAPSPGTAQDRTAPPDTMAHLQGLVVLEREQVPLKGAFLHLEGMGLATRTDTLGRFDLGRVPPGAHKVTLHHPLWQVRDLDPPSAVFSILAGETTELEWLLPSPNRTGAEGDPIPVEGITATVYADIRRRRADGSSGRYIGSAEIARLRGTGQTVADLVRDRVPSLRTVPMRRGFGLECVQTRRMGEDGLQILHRMVNPAPDCPDQVALIVDGIKILDPSTYLSSLSLDVVESVEFVPSAVAGARYGTGFGAGVLVVETRER